MSTTPDLSKIVGLIMQNPELIAQISALANSESEVSEAEEKDSVKISENEVEAVSLPPRQFQVGDERNMRAHRHELLSAMKPYLSEQRRTAIDSMSSILDILDVMMKKG